MTILRGPADLSIFRDDPTSWKTYTDPLPACDIATPDGTVPSVSTIKSVDPKFGLLPWAAEQVANAALDNHDAIGTMPRDAAVDMLKRAADRHRDSAAERGRTIHHALENLVEGRPAGIPLDDEHGAHLYADTIAQIVADLEPHIIAAEVVVFGDGYAGTFDAIWLITQRLADLLKLPAELVGCLIIVDYKTRKATKAATRDALEGAQLGGYSAGRYWIIEDESGIHRMVPLDVSAGLLISIAPDGYAPYVVDIEAARTHWNGAHAWYQCQQGATKMFSRGRTIKVEGPPPATPERIAWMLDRIDAIKAAGGVQQFGADWPDGVAKPAAVRAGDATWDAAAMVHLVRRADDVEGRLGMPFGADDPERPTKVAEALERPAPAPKVAPPAPRQFTPSTVDDGLFADPTAVTDLRAELKASPKALRDLVLSWSAVAHEHGVGWGMGRGRVPLRNYCIANAALRLVTGFASETFTSIVGELSAAEAGDAYDISPGVWLGLLTAEQADDLATRLTTTVAA